MFLLVWYFDVKREKWSIIKTVWKYNEYCKSSFFQFSDLATLDICWTHFVLIILVHVHSRMCAMFVREEILSEQIGKRLLQAVRRCRHICCLFSTPLRHIPFVDRTHLHPFNSHYQFYNFSCFLSYISSAGKINAHSNKLGPMRPLWFTTVLMPFNFRQWVLFYV